MLELGFVRAFDPGEEEDDLPHEVNCRDVDLLWLLNLVVSLRWVDSTVEFKSCILQETDSLVLFVV